LQFEQINATEQSTRIAPATLHRPIATVCGCNQRQIDCEVVTGMIWCRRLNIFLQNVYRFTCNKPIMHWIRIAIMEQMIISQILQIIWSTGRGYWYFFNFKGVNNIKFGNRYERRSLTKLSSSASSTKATCYNKKHKVLSSKYFLLFSYMFSYMYLRYVDIYKMYNFNRIL